MTELDRQSYTDFFTGCLLGGAVGDALGAPVEFISRERILQTYGAGGIRDYAPAYGGHGRITDDTQMALFTAEGLLRATVCASMRGICNRQAVVASAYERWLHTQGIRSAAASGDDWLNSGWLIGHPELHSQRAPGTTCVDALSRMPYLGAIASNDSKGCGGVMRAAPVGLYCFDEMRGATAFQTGVDIAVITHAHPTGYLSAGALAQIVAHLSRRHSLPVALRHTRDMLTQYGGHEETLRALLRAEELAGQNIAPHEAIARLGQGWVAEEALAISVYCALVAENFEEGVCLAVNHDGDSDSTGSITGNLLGVIHGRQAIPAHWLARLELGKVIEEIALDLLMCDFWEVNELGGRDNEWLWKKYPGY